MQFCCDFAGFRVILPNFVRLCSISFGFVGISCDSVRFLFLLVGLSCDFQGFVGF